MGILRQQSQRREILDYAAMPNLGTHAGNAILTTRLTFSATLKAISD